MQGLAATGRSLAATHAATLRRIEAKYGVPGDVVVAIWGRESGFGRAKLPHSVVDVLATKAYMSTRKEMFRTELIDALKIVESGDIAASRMMGSGQARSVSRNSCRRAISNMPLISMATATAISGTPCRTHWHP